ncbi:MAG: hypothetical protein J6X49_05120 [Victivallales bacterium]|nr:hypothetical protein [Victivallales bacterium]
MENEWSDKLGPSEPFSGVLQSQTRDLFESQPSRERKTVVPRLENSPGKGRFVLDWREWTIRVENGRRVRNRTIIGSDSVGNRMARN